MLEMVVAIIVFGALLGLIVKGLTDKEQTCKQYSLLSNPAFAMYNEGKEVKAENDTSYVLHPMGKMVHQYYLMSQYIETDIGCKGGC